MENKVLITGGAGYLGSVLTRHLLERGYRVTCLDDSRHKQISLLDCANNPNFDFIPGDVRNRELLESVISNFDTIIPLAAIVGASACKKDPIGAKSINLDAVVELDDLRSSDQRIIFPNTNSGYGTSSGEIECDENTPLNPISLYGQTKVDAEKYLLDSDKPSITLRLATVFGVSQRMRRDLLVNDFVYQAMTSGCIELFEKDFIRNYIHIRDVARAFEHCIENFGAMRSGKNQTFNLGLDDANLSKWELALKIREHIPNFSIYEGEGEDPDKRNYIVSNKKILSTGFSPRFSLDDGIKELMVAYTMISENDPYKNM